MNYYLTLLLFLLLLVLYRTYNVSNYIGFQGLVPPGNMFNCMNSMGMAAGCNDCSDQIKNCMDNPYEYNVCKQAVNTCGQCSTLSPTTKNNIAKYCGNMPSYGVFFP